MAFLKRRKIVFICLFRMGFWQKVILYLTCHNLKIINTIDKDYHFGRPNTYECVLWGIPNPRRIGLTWYSLVIMVPNTMVRNKILERSKLWNFMLTGSIYSGVYGELLWFLRLGGLLFGFLTGDFPLLKSLFYSLFWFSFFSNFLLSILTFCSGWNSGSSPFLM